jgi:hypothetical protein
MQVQENQSDPPHQQVVVTQGNKIATIDVPKASLSAQHSTAADLFQFTYETIKREVPFQVKWSNGTGYFDAICWDKQLAVDLKPGELAKSSDEQDRQIILIGTRHGAVAVFQRYPGDHATLVANMPIEVSRLKMANGPRLELENLLSLVGYGQVRNIGQMCELFAAAANV